MNKTRRYDSWLECKNKYGTTEVNKIKKKGE